jgi:chemotaxis-related protein WspD
MISDPLRTTHQPTASATRGAAVLEHGSGDWNGISLRARGFFDREAPNDYLAEWSRRLALPEERRDRDLLSLLIFRLGREMLALETAALVEVTHPQPVHVIPHRSTEVLLGLVNIRGQLRICVSAHGLLGVELAPAAEAHGHGPHDDSLRRMMILQDKHQQWVFPVEEVVGVHRLAQTALREVPSTFGRASSFSRAVFTWGDHTVGLLDEARLLVALRSACT